MWIRLSRWKIKKNSSRFVSFWITKNNKKNNIKLYRVTFQFCFDMSKYLVWFALFSTLQYTIIQSYIRRHIDVQVAWRRLNYRQAHAIDM